MIKQPAITALMPVFNGELYIREAIDSVLAQTFTDFELLIINDGSTDGSENIVRSYADTRIILVNQSNQGVAKALNAGLQVARGKYVARIDADDLCMPNRFSTQFDFLEANPDYVLAGSTADYIDESGDYIFTLRHKAYTNEEIDKLPITICPFSHSTVMFNRNVILQAKGYDENAHNFEDHLLWLRLKTYGKLCNLKPMLAKIRFNPASVTIDEKWRSRRFREIKYNALRSGQISAEEGQELLALLREQNTVSIKESAYYSLLAKSIFGIIINR